MTTKETIRGSEDSFSELAAARDEVRLKLHLLSLEARDRWNEIEEKIANLEHSVAQSSGRISEAAARRARALTRSIRSFVRTHLRPASKPASGPTSA